jgi:hypothetical protein
MTSMNATELHAVRDALRQRLVELDRIKTTCDHCEHFGMAPRCDKFNAVPPEDFRRTPGACEHWQFDGIPF